MKNNFYSKVFLWLFIGLLITFGSGLLVLTSPSVLSLLFSGYGYLIVIVLQIVLCLFLSARIDKMKPTTAKLCYLGYTFLTGLTFSSLFLIFNFTSILFVFLVTSILLLIFGLFGKYTKLDLSKISIFLLIGLVGVVILNIINVFIMNNTLDMISCVISLIIFLGFMAWDMQKIKGWAEQEASDNYAILGAFELYLDFINVFIDLLRLFGDRN